MKSKKTIQRTYLQNRLTDLENKLTVVGAGEECGEGIVEFGRDIYTLLYLNWVTDFIFTFHFHQLEQEMATYSSILAWKIPGTGEPGGLPSMGSHRVGHD